MAPLLPAAGASTPDYMACAALSAATVHHAGPPLECFDNKCVIVHLEISDGDEEGVLVTLPNFVIAGERRCGTSTLADLLSTHPRISVHPKRDSGFFIDRHIRKGNRFLAAEDDFSAENYAHFFADLPRGPESLICEKSADYLYFRPAHLRMAAALPDAKFIFILRNPVDRAWSHYWNEVAKGRETCSFHEAIGLEDERLAAGGYKAYHCSYVARGFYDESLRDFFDVIERRRCHVMILEDMIRNPKASLDELLAFVGLHGFADMPLMQARNSNWATLPRPWARGEPVRSLAKIYGIMVSGLVHSTVRDRNARRALIRKLNAPFKTEANGMRMSTDDRSRLEGVFRPHITALEQLIGRQIDSWRHRQPEAAEGFANAVASR